MNFTNRLLILVLNVRQPFVVMKSSRFLLISLKATSVLPESFNPRIRIGIDLNEIEVELSFNHKDLNALSVIRWTAAAVPQAIPHDWVENYSRPTEHKTKAILTGG